MVIHSLTPEQAVTLAFELAGGSESFERAEQLAWVGAMYPPELPSSDYSTGLALSVFLEVGDSPACKITGHKYIDAALYLQRHGYYREASIIAHLEVSHWLSVFLGLNDRLAAFPTSHHDAPIGEWLMSLDANVAENGAIVANYDERIRSVMNRHGAHSPYVSAWLATISSSAPKLLDLPVMVTA